MRMLAALRSLRSLSLPCCISAPSGLGYLAFLPALTHLNACVRAERVAEAGLPEPLLAAALRLRQVRRLELRAVAHGLLAAPVAAQVGVGAGRGLGGGWAAHGRQDGPPGWRPVDLLTPAACATTP
jgi:hypothetical protein